jgi:Ca2+-binding RTX toxin-like protein
MRVALLVAVLCGMGLPQPTPAGAATASVVGPNTFGQLTLRYVADPGEANDVFVDFAPDPVVAVDVTDSGATITAGAGCATLTLHRVRCNVSSDDLINASLGDGNDIFSISLFLDTGGGRLSGGDGDDRIRGNNFAGTNEILLGGRGDDSLFGRGGSEYLDGGPGGDDLSGGTSCEGLTAGICATDIDIVSYASRTKNVHADADGTTGDDGYRFEGDTIMDDVERLIGGRGDDHLGATPTSFAILEGHAGDDVLHGGPASDSLVGGQGDDRMRGEGGDDRMLGGLGGDRLVGGPGRDRFSGGKGQDRLLARDGHADRVNGGAGRDAAQIDPTLDHVARVENLF